MGGLTRRPISVPKVKTRKELPRPKNVVALDVDLDELAFGKKSKMINPKVIK